MPVPYRFNPMGKSNKPTAFEMAVKPGILSSTMDFSLMSKWDSGGYCFVDWGDGNSERLSWNTAKTHSYAVAGTYKIRIQAECTLLSFTPRNLLYNCSNNWDILNSNGANVTTFDICPNAIFTMTTLPESMTDGSGLFWSSGKAQLPLKYLPKGLVRGADMFYGCGVATLPLTSLPEGLIGGYEMFSGCAKAKISLTSLPAGLKNGYKMFSGCSIAEINLDTLVANAPAEGWTNLTNIANMFYGCAKVTGSRSAFLAKCPNVTNITDAFTGTNTTE